MSVNKVIIKYQELVKHEQGEEVNMTTINMKVINSLSANQVFFTDYESLIVNEMFSEWIWIESEDQQKIFIARYVMKDKILIN